MSYFIEIVTGGHQVVRRVGPLTQVHAEVLRRHLSTVIDYRRCFVRMVKGRRR